MGVGGYPPAESHGISPATGWSDTRLAHELSARLRAESCSDSCCRNLYWRRHGLWLGSWYQAQGAGDTEAVSAALATLNDARSWTTLTNELSSDQAFRDNIQARIDAARAGDAGLVLDELAMNCSRLWPPTDGG